jgi:cell division protein ZapB
MISEFEIIAEKIKKLSEMTHALRLENAELRRNAASLITDNQDLHQRMQQAHQRIEKILAQLPADSLSGDDADDAGGANDADGAKEGKAA